MGRWWRWIVLACLAGLLVFQLQGRSQELPPEVQAEITEAVYLNQQAYDLFQRGDGEGAIATYEQARAIFRRHRAPAGEGNSLNGIGEVYLALKDPEQARRRFQDALSLFKDLPDPLSVAYTLQFIGEAHRDLRQLSPARAAYSEALELFTTLPPDPLRADQASLQTSEIYTRTAIAALDFQTGDYPTALTQYQTILALQQERTDKIGSAYTLNNIGVVYANLGQYAPALHAYQTALGILQELAAAGVRYWGEEAAILNNLSSLFMSLGDTPQALDYAQQASQRHNEWLANFALTPPPLELELLRDAVGQSLLSPTAVHQDFAVRSPLGRIVPTDLEQAGEALTLNNLGQIYAREGNLPQALAMFNKARQSFQTLGNDAALAVTLSNIAQIYEQQGEGERAIATQTEALNLAKRIGDTATIALATANLAHHYQEQGNLRAAAPLYQQALETSEAIPRAFAQRNLGRLRLEEGKITEAIPLLMAAIQTLEDLRPGLSDGAKITLFDQGKTAYQGLQKALIAQNQPEAALEVAERGRARAFVERIGDHAQLPPAAIQPPNIAAIRATARNHGATVVEYSLIDAQTLYTWVIQPQGRITFHQTAITPMDADFNSGDLLMSDVVVRTRNLMLGQRVERAQLALHHLYQVLIAPIAAELPTDPTATVVIIPQDTLFLVPFAALQDEEGKAMISDHAIATAPSIQTLALLDLQPPGRGNKTLIVGNPTMPALSFSLNQPPQPLEPLPGAEAEAEAIAALLNVQPLTGGQATETAVLEQLRDAKIVHLATHGLLDEVRSWSSLPGAIALAPDAAHDGLLTALDVLNTHLNADLVVLSACNTGRGQLTGDGVVGLSRGFLGAGAKSAIVSLWAVPDQPTALLMTEFYRQWQGGLAKPQALRQAMLTTQAQYPAAKNWSGFTLIGGA
ncbi:CHAT domain-containing protein [Spirulina sp. CCNP1310]|uniref:CHAT domain-containing tetratricopeptide repeat protein n=1 Tax=Spirulina sp. CCNP1310 TaxID=3110249 RepID=UPI002B2090EA|nr:CHAT domain-containing protein [Spirulina sp. CCNP1310]MEA5419478.1 CHAT domain-containing protein [Spirulina sp. CCNP1310]